MFGATGTVGHPLRLAWPPWKPPPGNGVVAAVAETETGTGWADALLARVDHLRYVWVAAASPEQSGLEVLNHPGVLAATLAPEGADPRHTGLSLEVSHRLRARRGAGAGKGGCLTSWSPPTPPPGAVRAPHLVTVWHGTVATDSVVWEVIAAARRWPGLLPDLSFVEANLHQLTSLRTAARTGNLPPTAAAVRLLSLLGPDRELPIELVYERPDLFRVLLRPGSADPY